MRRILLIVAAVLVALGLVIRLRRSAAPARPEIRNVLLISLDTTRADYLSCYGYPHQTTPNLDALAARGVLFENVVSPVPLTLPAHATMLTGTIPPYHAVHDNLFLGLRPEIETLAEVLAANGFTTGAIVSAVVLHRIYGLDQGFDSYADRFDGPDDTAGAERRGDVTTRLALEWLRELGDEPFFLFLHYFDPHYVYDPPEPYASRFPESPYAGEIAFTDHCVGQVLDALQETGHDDSTLIVVVGDHGEMLDEHDEPSHGFFVYQSGLRVPLIIKAPGGAAAQRMRSITGVVDVTPTICSLLGLEPPSPCHGRDLASSVVGRAEPVDPRYLYCESLVATKYRANGLRGLVGDRWKYIHTTRPELYDLVADPYEVDNVVAAHADVAESLRSQLDDALAHREDAAVRAEPDEKMLARLRSLGYITGPMSMPDALGLDEDMDDPKDLIGFHNLMGELQVLIDQGSYERAGTIGRSLLRQRPDVPDVRMALGNIAFKEGRFEAARSLFREALALDTEHYLAAKQLGEASEALGLMDEAIDFYTRALAIRPNSPHIHYKLAHLHYQRGDLDLALVHAGVSARQNPGVPAVHTALARTHRDLGNVDQAIEHYYRAIELKPDAAVHLNSLAWLLAVRAEPSARHTSEAVRIATQACELTGYEVPEPLDTLAAAQAASGDFAAAVGYAQRAMDLYLDRGDQALADQTGQRLQLYRTGRPYRQ